MKEKREPSAKLNKILKILGTAAAFNAVEPAPASAQAVTQKGWASTLSDRVADKRFIPLFAETEPPPGWKDFCKRMEEKCAAMDATPSERMERRAGDESDMTNLREVNSRINTIPAVADKAQSHGREEQWDIGIFEADCEDYVLAKREALMQQKDKRWYAKDLLIAVVRIPGGEIHAVLIVRTKQGDFILDNRSDDVVLWSEQEKRGYQFIMRQGYMNPDVWYSLSP